MSVRSFAASYGAGASRYEILGYEPTAATSPVYIYLPGTTMFGRVNASLAFARFMAESHGFVAAVVNYPEHALYNPGTCAYFEHKAATIFSGASSALATICSRQGANCDLGVAMHGFSQGAHLALLAARFEPRVRAVLTMGNGIRLQGVWADAWHDHTLVPLTARPVLSCLRDAVISEWLPRTRRRSLVGADDEFFGGLPSAVPRVHAQQRALSGPSRGVCDDDDCIEADGSGYVVVQGMLDLDRPRASHSFFLDFASGRPAALHPRFATGNASWAMRPSLAWLAATARVPRDHERQRVPSYDHPSLGVWVSNGLSDALAHSAAARIGLQLALLATPFCALTLGISLRSRRARKVGATPARAAQEMVTFASSTDSDRIELDASAVQLQAAAPADA